MSILETYFSSPVRANMAASEDEGLSDEELLGQMSYVT